MRKALVLAAGFGTRLHPFTAVTPKALMPIWGVPLLEHALRRLESWGVEEIAVNVHSHPEKMVRYLKERQRTVPGSAKLHVSVEEGKILGTGGALRPLQRFFGDEPFWILNADVVASIEKKPLEQAFRESGSFAAVWLEPKRGPRTVEADRKRRITSFHSDVAGAHGTYTLCGLHLLSPDFFRYLPEREFCTLVEAYEAAMYDNRFAVGAVDPKSYWADSGTPDAYLKIHGELKDRAYRNLPGGEFYRADLDRIPANERNFFCVSATSSLSSDVKGVNSIIGDGTRIESGANIQRSILHGGSFAGKLQRVLAVPLAAYRNAPDSDPQLASLSDEEWTGIQPLGRRGSNRSFYRLFSPSRTAIGIAYTDERAENKRYGKHTALLAEAGVPVPQVIHDFGEDEKMLVLEDWGDDNLQARVLSRPYETIRLYAPVIHAVAALHRDVTRLVRERGVELEPAFDAALYGWERGLFAKHLLDERFGIEQLPTEVENELRMVADTLQAQPQVVIHRDLQSSNVLMRGGKFCLIDFQGMRLGAAAYDLASLLYDPYVKLCAADRRELAKRYVGEFPEQADAAGKHLHLGAVQRLVQALGAYGRLASVGQKQFTRHILPGLENLHEVAELAGLHAVAELCHDLLKRENMREDRAPSASPTSGRNP